jgi:hypothetical protein
LSYQPGRGSGVNEQSSVHKQLRVAGLGHPELFPTVSDNTAPSAPPIHHLPTQWLSPPSATDQWATNGRPALVCAAPSSAAPSRAASRLKERSSHCAGGGAEVHAEEGLL